jgi:histone H3/H4
MIDKNINKNINNNINKNINILNMLIMLNNIYINLIFKIDYFYLKLYNYINLNMDKSDFSFMKSGFNSVQANQEQEDIEKNVVGTIVHFAENALKTAGYYTKHSGRNMITKEDIKRCFMLEVFLFYNRQNLVENIEKVIHELYKNSSDEEDEEGEEKKDENEIIFEEDIESSFKLSSCECALCKSLNNINEKWNNWTPETPMQEILQKHINNI